MLSGVLAGHWIRSTRGARAKVMGLLAAGGAEVGLGSVWGRAFPINKNLWTGSSVLLTAGIACAVLASTCWLVHVKGCRAWARPFLVFGTNAITAWPGLFTKPRSAGRPPPHPLPLAGERDHQPAPSPSWEGEGRGEGGAPVRE